MRIEAAARSDLGRKRESNEDSYLVRHDLGLYAVADGMGGHAAGEVASGIAIETLERGVPPGGTKEALASAFLSGNDAILDRAEHDPETAGMGTTLTALLAPWAGPGCLVCHAGDSRAYLLRAGELRQLTRDHTWVQEEVDRGRLTAAQARVHPYASVITRALGVQRTLDVDLIEEDLRAGDLLLLCSDGLTGMVDDPELLRILTSDQPLPHLAEKLVDAANLHGGADNITVVLLRASE